MIMIRKSLAFSPIVGEYSDLRCAVRFLNHAEHLSAYERQRRH